MRTRSRDGTTVRYIWTGREMINVVHGIPGYTWKVGPRDVRMTPEIPVDVPVVDIPYASKAVHGSIARRV